MRRDDALDERRDARAVEHVELRRLLLEDPREGELLDRAPPGVGRVQRDVRGVLVVLRVLDGQESVLGGVGWRGS